MDIAQLKRAARRFAVVALAGVGLAGCYWIGHYHPPPDVSGFEHHFEPIHPEPKAMMGGDSVGKSFWHEESQRSVNLPDSFLFGPKTVTK